MTREEAIRVLEKEKRFLFHGSPSDKCYEPAFDMAIEVLEQIRAIEDIIDVSNITIQEDVIKYKMIVDVVKGEGLFK